MTKMTHPKNKDDPTEKIPLVGFVDYILQTRLPRQNRSSVMLDIYIRQPENLNEKPRTKNHVN